MSLFGSLFTGVAALNAQSQSMSMISDNIANVNTVGYKKKVAAFESMVTAQNQSVAYSSGGVVAATQAQVTQQGQLQQSTSATDIGVSGAGFFTVSSTPTNSPTATEGRLLTRSGSFTEDSSGILKNAAGFYLLGWPLDANGALPAGSAQWESLQPVNVSATSGQARATSTAELGLNLDAAETDLAPVSGSNFSRSMQVFNSLGAAHDVTLAFSKAAASPSQDWNVAVSYIDQAGAPQAATLSAGTLTFDSSGKISVPANGTLTVTVPDWGNGSAGAQAIAVDVSKVTSNASDYSVLYTTQNGAAVGQRTGVEIDKDGFVTATFSNGERSKLFKLPVAHFSNPNGLREVAGNAYVETSDSGLYNLAEAGKGGAGQITPGTLEASNVDLADEFSKMIVTQRAYSAGTKIINTADQMLTELLQLR